MAGDQVLPVVRKEKKKQVKDETDRHKQAEKKKRRLEKALANSAAIISELEKKKQKKKEEQQRLDEEGAAIAEAVALHVLGEDSDDSHKIVLNKEEHICPYDFDTNIGLFMGGWRADIPHQGFTRPSLEGGLGWVSDDLGSECKWNNWGISNWSFSPRVFEGDACFEERSQGAEFSAGFIAAQAVSALQIAEDGHADIVFKGLFRE